MSKRGTASRKLREEEQQAIGAIYKQYIDTFQENSDIPRKTFIKSETLYGESGSDKGQLYTPKPIIKLRKEASPHRPPESTFKRTKKKSNLKALGDELKMLQHERQLKEVKLVLPKTEPPTNFVWQESDYVMSTNLFVSNLSPHITEGHLIQLFGTYGPLASVKIMWPRNETSSKTANCGFVAFMSRADAERALDGLRNYEDMKINWGKAVKIPPHPVHIPPELCKLYSPPPLSGLPFNAQTAEKGDQIDLAKAVVKVTIPFNRNLLMRIHRMVEFVVREGPEFEAMIMTMEVENPDFYFLFDFQDPAHTYYRWKLYSILHGDPKNSWSMKPFRMFQTGPIWLPPTAPNYKDGMPKELIVAKKPEAKLTETQANHLIRLIKNLTLARCSIREAMIYCLSRAKAIDDILEILVDSLMNPATNPVKKVGRLLLLSDVVYNCKVKKVQVRFGEANPGLCFELFRQFHKVYKDLSTAQDKECLKMKVFTVLRSWVYHSFYDVRFVTKLENVFLCGNEVGEDDDNSLNDEPLDGANLLKRSFQTATTDCLIVKNKTEATNKKEMFFDIFNSSSAL